VSNLPIDFRATQRTRATRPVGVLLAAALAFGASAPADAQTSGANPGHWQFSVTPYLWLPSVDGTLKYQLPPGSGSPTVEVDSETLLDALDFGFMLAGEARRGRWSVFADYIYLKLSASKSAVRSVDFNVGAPAINPSSTTANLGTEATLKGSVLTLAGGYSLSDNSESRMDAIAGLRYFHVTATTSWQLTAAVNGPGPGQTFAAAGSISQSEDLWDAIVGVRGWAKLGGRWFLPYYLDVGTGSSDLTWQALAGLSYGFKWGELTFAYRHLVYDQKDDKLLQDFKFSGPMLAATFRF